MAKSNNPKNLAFDSLSLSVIRIVTLAIGMVTTMLLARQRTLLEYGTYSQIKMVATLAISIFSVGLTSSVNFFIGRAENDNEKRRFTKTYFTSITVISLVCGAILAICSPLFEIIFVNEGITDYIFVLILLPNITLITGSLDNYLISQKKNKILYIFQITHNVTILGIAAITYIFELNLMQYLIMLTIENMIAVVVTYSIVGKVSSSIPFGFEPALLKKILKYSIPIGLAGVVGTLSIEMDKLLIAVMTETETYAIYENIAKELPFSIIIASVSAVMVPQFTRLIKDNNSNEAFSLWSKSSDLGFIIMSFISIMLIVFAEPIIVLLYSAKYLPGITVFRVYSLVTMIKFTYFGMMLNSAGKTKFIFFSSIISLISNAVLNFLLYYLLGIIGPAIATILSILIINIIQLLYSCKIGNVKFRNLFPWKSMLITLIINLFLGLCAYILFAIFCRFTTIPDLISAIMIGFAGCIACFLINRKKILCLWKDLNA